MMMMMMSRAGRHRCNRRRYHQLQCAREKVANWGEAPYRRGGGREMASSLLENNELPCLAVLAAILF